MNPSLHMLIKIPTSVPRLATAALLLVCQLTLADNIDMANEDDYLSEIPIVLTATHLIQPIDETPVATSIIDHDTIEAIGATNIADLMRLVPGMQVGHGSGNSFSVTYHGNSSNFSRRMQVQIDGRSVYSPLLSIVDWTHLGVAMEDIERIEVIRGSNTPIDGTNSFIGTINIITRQPFEDKGVSISATQGSQSYRRALIRLAGEWGKLEQRLTLVHREDDGFDRINDGQNIDMAAYRGSYFPTSRDSYDLQLGYSSGPEGIGKGEALDPNRNKETRAYYGFIRWQRALSDTDELHVQFYFNRLVWQDRQDIVGPLSTVLGGTPAAVLAFTGNPDQSFSLGQFDGLADRMDLDFRYTLALGDRLRVIWGGGLRRDRFQTAFNLDRPDPIDNDSRRLNGHLEWVLSDALIANVGTMIEYNDLSNTEISPRFAINYHLDQAQTLRWAVTRSARMPSIYEARGLSVVRFKSGAVVSRLLDNARHAFTDSSVRPERLETYELGYLLSLPKQGLQLDTKLFQDKISQIIAAPTARPFPDDLVDNKVAVWMNAGNITIQGLDVGLDWRPLSQTRLHLGYGYGKAHGRLLKRINRDTGQAIVSPSAGNHDVQAYSVPRHTLSLLAIQQFPRQIDASLSWYHVSRMEWLGDGDILDGYDRFDMRLAKGFQLLGARSSLSLMIQNLLNDSYQDLIKDNNFGRRIFVSFNTQY